MVTCTDYDCYKSAATMQRKMNSSASSPCNNFYQYACSRWQQAPLSGESTERTVLIEIEKENNRRLNEAIMADIDPLRHVPWAYEYKLKQFFQTCLNQYQTTNYFDTTNPLFDLIDAMKGWYVFDPNIVKDFDWFRAFRRTLSRDSLVDAFFHWDIEPWDQQHKKYLISIQDDFKMPLPFYKWDLPGEDVSLIYLKFKILKYLFEFPVCHSIQRISETSRDQNGTRQRFESK